MTRRWKHWTSNDDRLLRKFHAEGKNDPEIAALLVRHPVVIGNKRRALGLPKVSMAGRFAGWKQTPEAKAKIAESNRRRWARRDFRERMLPLLHGQLEEIKQTSFRAPLPKTPEGRLYAKIRDVLGVQAAREAVL